MSKPLLSHLNMHLSCLSVWPSIILCTWHVSVEQLITYMNSADNQRRQERLQEEEGSKRARVRETAEQREARLAMQAERTVQYRAGRHGGL